MVKTNEFLVNPNKFLVKTNKSQVKRGEYQVKNKAKFNQVPSHERQVANQVQSQDNKYRIKSKDR